MRATIVCTFSFFSVSSFKEADSASRVSRASPLTMLAGGVAPFNEPRRAAAVPFMEAVTRGETAERAVAPLAMEEVGVVGAVELVDGVRRDAGVALAGAAVAMACQGRVYDDGRAEMGGPALVGAEERRAEDEEEVVAKAYACAAVLDGSTLSHHAK